MSLRHPVSLIWEREMCEIWGTHMSEPVRESYIGMSLISRISRFHIRDMRLERCRIGPYICLSGCPSCLSYPSYISHSSLVLAHTYVSYICLDMRDKLSLIWETICLSYLDIYTRHIYGPYVRCVWHISCICLVLAHDTSIWESMRAMWEIWGTSRESWAHVS